MSNCPLPCSTTRISARTLDKTKDPGMDTSTVDLTFYENVMVSTTKYPKFNFVDFLSNIGGSMGLLLGLGVSQLFETLTSSLFEKLESMLLNKNIK